MQKDKQRNDVTNEMLTAEYEAVYRYALTLCRDEVEAQDITQESFYKALRSKKSFQGNSSLYTWLCAIAKNLWINRCKKLGREVAEDGRLDEMSAPSKSVEQMIEEQDTSKLIHKILHTLEEPYKEVFSLRTFGELSFKDIADIFSKKESWARVTYHRAKKMILEKMK